MIKAEIIEYLYDNNVRGDITIEQMAEDLAEQTENSSEKPNNCEDEFFREPTAEERKAVADYIDSISVPTGVNVFDLMDEPQTDYIYDRLKDYEYDMAIDQTDCPWK